MHTGHVNDFDGSVKRIAFHADHPRLITQDADATIRFWDLSRNQARVLNTLDGQASALTVLDDEGRWCFRVLGTLEAQEWDSNTGMPVGTPWKVPPGVHGGAISADGRRVALLVPGESIEIRNAADGQLLSEAVKARDNVREVLLSPEATKCSPSTTTVWRACGECKTVRCLPSGQNSRALPAAPISANRDEWSSCTTAMALRKLSTR